MFHDLRQVILRYTASGEKLQSSVWALHSIKLLSGYHIGRIVAKIKFYHGMLL